MYTFQTSNIYVVGLKSSTFKTLSPYTFSIHYPNDFFSTLDSIDLAKKENIYKLDNFNGGDCAQRLLILLVLGVTYLTRFTCIATTLEVGNVMDGSWAIIYMFILQLTEYSLTYPMDSC